MSYKARFTRSEKASREGGDRAEKGRMAIRSSVYAMRPFVNGPGGGSGLGLRTYSELVAPLFEGEVPVFLH